MGNHVFVCYAREDESFVLKLAASLKNLGVPIWLDQWNIPSGADWDLTIDNALYECAQFLIVLSETSVKSIEVRSELRTVLDEKKPIVPILYQSCRIPRQLRLIQRADFTSCSPDDVAALNQVLKALGMGEGLDNKAIQEQIAGGFLFTSICRAIFQEFPFFEFMIRNSLIFHHFSLFFRQHPLS
jgi:hypothetical protein